MSIITTTLAPLSEVGTEVRNRRRALADRLGFSTKPRNIVVPNLTAPIVYGRALVNGRLVFAHKPSNTTVSHLVFVYAAHEIEAFEDVLYSDRVLKRDGSGQIDATDPVFGWIDTFEHLGTDAQTADQTLINEVGTSFWTTAHRLRGLAYLYFQTAFTEAKFSTEEPEALQAIIKGAKVFDTRTSTVGFSTNPALCLRDYLTNTRYGRGEPTTDMDDTSFNKAADDCDTLGFTIGAVIETDTDPLTVIDQIVDAMGGTLTRLNGRFSVKAGVFEAATVTLGEDDLIVGREPTIAPRRPAGDLVNGMRGIFIEPARKWQETDIPAVTDPALVTEDGGFERLGDKRLPLVTNVNQAQHLLSIDLQRGRRQVTVSAGFKLAALQVRPADVMALNYTRNGITFSAKPFLIETLAVGVDGTEFSVSLDLREIDAAVFTPPTFVSLPVLTEIIIFVRENPDVADPEEQGELRVGGLELFNATVINGIEFTDDDAKFVWRTVSGGTSFEFGSEPAGAGSGAPAEDFRDFRVRIFDSDSITLRREEFLIVEFFDYTLAMNQEDGIGTPATDFVIEVTLRTFSGDRDSRPVRHSASNPELGRDDFSPIDEVSGSFAWDAGARPKRTIRLIGNATLLNPTNAKEGATLLLYVFQDNTGGRTLGYSNRYNFPNKTDPVINTTAGAKNIFSFIVRGGIADGVMQPDFGRP